MKTMRKQGLRWVVAAFVACLVVAPAQAVQVFVDNFANDVVYDADAVPGIWQVRKGSYGRTSFVSATEANGFLTIETNDRYGGGIATYSSPDFDFFARPLKFTIEGLSLSGTGHPSYQGVRIGVTPNGGNPFQRVNQLELAFNGNRHFTLMAFRNAQLNYLVNLDYSLPVIPERIELVLDATRYGCGAGGRGDRQSFGGRSLPVRPHAEGVVRAPQPGRPATVMRPMQMEPVRMARRVSTSDPTASMAANISFRLPATVISSTGWRISPFSTQKPAAPRE